MVGGVEHLGQRDEVKEDGGDGGWDGDVPPAGTVVEGSGQNRERGYAVEKDCDSEPEEGHRKVRERLNWRIFSISGSRDDGPGALGMLLGVNAFAVILSVFLLAPAGLRSQAQSDVDAAVLLQRAVDKYEQAKASKTRFTYLELTHTKNFSEKGKKTVDYTELFEVTYIADLEYSRLLEVDGKALKGTALEAEQKRYDDAVRERSALDGYARAKIQHKKMLNSGINFRALTTDYRSSVVDHVVEGDCACVLIDAVPLSSAAKKHYRIWVDPVTSEIRRLDFNQLADEGDLLSGGAGTETLQYMDGIPLVVRSHFDVYSILINKKVRVVSDHDYTRFRKFLVTTTIVPVEPGDRQ
jgi:hypothetical protein